MSLILFVSVWIYMIFGEFEFIKTNIFTCKSHKSKYEDIPELKENVDQKTENGISINSEININNNKKIIN